MKIALISDIHSNLEALTVILDDIHRRRPDTVWCLGDIAGYNADPDRCCELVRVTAEITIMGNHDGAATAFLEPSHFNEVAKEAVMWDRKVMRRENIEYLMSLKSAVVIDEEVLLVHGSPSDPEKYIMSDTQVKEEMDFMVRHLERRIGFFGHTHFPVVHEMNGKGVLHTTKGAGKVRLKEDASYLINPGSVGQPRDGDTRSSYLIFDRGEMTVEFVRLEYDIPTVQEKILKAGLPPFLAERLSNGY